MRHMLALVCLCVLLLSGCKFLESSQDYLESPQGQAQIETVVKKATSGDWTGAIIAGVTLVASTVVGGVAGSSTAKKHAKAKVKA